MSKTLPRDITSYDLIKSFAVILMIADHAGYYFFPDDNWWRVFGRLCVPVWFFLIGYANSRDIGPKMWIGALILVAGNVVAGMSIVPLNVLATMLGIRLLIDPVMTRAVRHAAALWGISAILFCLIIPSEFVVEYGTQGILMAMYGYLLRRRDSLKEPQKVILQYFIFTLVTFAGMQGLMFGMTRPQMIVLCMGTLAVMGVLYVFRPATFPRLTSGLGPLAPVLRFTGRHTLEIYVFHLLLFKFMGAWLEPARFVWFHWKWFSPTGV